MNTVFFIFLSIGIIATLKSLPANFTFGFFPQYCECFVVETLDSVISFKEYQSFYGRQLNWLELQLPILCPLHLITETHFHAWSLVLKTKKSDDFLSEFQLCRAQTGACHQAKILYTFGSSSSVLFFQVLSPLQYSPGLVTFKDLQVFVLYTLSSVYKHNLLQGESKRSYLAITRSKTHHEEQALCGCLVVLGSNLFYSTIQSVLINTRYQLQGFVLI